MYQQKSRSNRTPLLLLGCPVLACTFFCLVCLAFGVVSVLIGGDTSDSTQTIRTSDDTLIVPGDAFIDGRDLESTEPITLKEINIWDTVPRGRVICTLEHGTAINLEEAKFLDDEQRWYLKVSANACEGWVSEPFVSSQKHDPVGELF